MTRPASGTPDGTQPEPEPSEPVTEPKVTSVESSGPVVAADSTDGDPSTDTTRGPTASTTFTASSAGPYDGPTATVESTLTTTATTEISEVGDGVSNTAAPAADGLPGAALGTSAMSLVLGFLAVLGAVSAVLVAQGLRYRRKK